MISQSFLPSPFLRDHVRMYHIRHFEFGSTSIFPFKPYPPRAECSLTFYPRDPETVEYVADGFRQKRPRSIIMGQHTVRTNRHVSKDFLVLIVHIQPGVFHRITGIPFDSITNTDIDAELIFPKEIKQVNERLNSSGNYQEMINIVETFLLLIIPKSKLIPDRIDDIGKLILDGPGRFSIDWLAQQACLSPRQFERKFKVRMGVGPKTFSRLARLHQTYQMKHKFPDEDWLSIAIACGYHDYQHLSKDYMEFAHATPVGLFNEDNEAPERLFGMKETF